MCGLMHITGDPDGPPCKVGIAATDIFTGLYAHGAILAALRHRDVTGQGQKIDCSLMESQLATLANVGTAWLIAGKEGKRRGTQHGSIVPYQAFNTKKGGYIVIGGNNEGQWQDLCKKLGPDADDLRTNPDLQSNAGRVENENYVCGKIQEIFMTKDRQQWLDEFEGSKFAYGPINTIEEAFAQPQVEARKMIETVQHAKAGEIKLMGIPVKFSDTPGKIRTAPPLLAADTDAVLDSIGVDETRREQLKKDKSVAWPSVE